MNVKTSLVALAALIATCTHAEEAAPAPREWMVGVHLVTYHFDKSQNFNNYNPGVYVVYREEWVAGAYYNSQRAASVYAAYVWRNALGTPIDITVGAVTGYARAAVLPLLVPSVKVFDAVRFSLLLPFDENVGTAIHLSYEF